MIKGKILDGVALDRILSDAQLKSKNRLDVPEDIAELFELEEGEPLVSMAPLSAFSASAEISESAIWSHWITRSSRPEECPKLIETAIEAEQTEKKANPFQFLKARPVATRVLTKN